MTKREITMLETAQHIAKRGTKALLGIESLTIKVRNILNSELSDKAKLEQITILNESVASKVMEGTSDLYVLKKNA